MKNQHLAKRIDTFVTNNLQKHLVPSVQGNTILMGAYKIKKKSVGYNIYNLGSNRALYVVNTLEGAVALTKCLNKSNTDFCKTIIEYDKDLSKHEVDLMFYEHTLKKTTNDVLKDALRTRVDLAKVYKDKLKSKLESFIYSL